LIGQSSSYIETLPQAVKSRLTGLKGLQAIQNKIESDFQKDLLELEKKYVARFAPIYDRRREIVLGHQEPNEEEIEKGIKEEEKDAEEEAEDEDEGVITELGRAATESEIAQAPKGIPEFWATALKNHLGIGEMITERDETLLKHLIDIRVSYPNGKPGFTLEFYFDKAKAAEFFSNEGGVLKKTYMYKDEVAYDGDFVFDKAEGTKIDWKEGKNLTVKIEKKKQRNKSPSFYLLSSPFFDKGRFPVDTGQTRMVKKAVPTESFFTFFTPPSADETKDDDDEDEDDDLLHKMELDYQIGVDFKERVSLPSLSFFPIPSDMS
jgi:nucleosome assembly protein 1-like 1